jgi:DNA-binding MarR family transcriptional regulator
MRIEAFLDQSPMFAVTRAARRFEALAAEALAADNLRFLEGLALAALFFEEKRAVRPSQLAEVFETTRGNISHCLSSLEAKGLVARRVDPEDARAFEIALKPAGKRAAVRVIAAFDQLQRSFEQTAGKRELAQMLTALRKLEEIQ